MVRVGGDIGEILMCPCIKNMFKSRINEVHQQHKKRNSTFFLYGSGQLGPLGPDLEDLGP